MTLPKITNPFDTYLALDGRGLNGGDVYIGVAGQDPETNPQAVYWDAAGTIPAAQPLEVLGGYVMRLGTPTRAYTASTYSIRVRDRQGLQVFYAETAYGLPEPFTAEDIPFLWPADGAYPRSLQDRGEDTISIMDFIPEEEHAAIRAGDGSSTYDIADAWEAAQYACDMNPSARIICGPEIHFPAGNYYTSRPLIRDRTVNVYGESGGKSGGHATTIRVAAGQDGWIDAWFMANDATTTTSAGAVLRGMTFQSLGGLVGHGVWVRSRVSYHNITCIGFGGNGRHIDADSRVGAENTPLAGNANSSTFIDFWAYQCRGWGSFVQGFDANQITFIGDDCTDNDLGGFYDNSLLGNCYISPHTLLNVGPPFQIGNATSQNTIIAPYSEGGQPDCKFFYTTTVVGYPKGGGGVSTTTPWNAAVHYGTAFGMKVLNSLLAATTDSGGAAVESGLGWYGTADGTAAYFTNATHGPLGFKFRWFNSNLGFLYNAIGGLTVLWTGPTTTSTFGRSAAFPFAMCVDQFVLGDNSGGGNGSRAHFTSLAIPTTGAHAQGEIAWSSASAAAGKAGWYCTVAGTPGTWKPFAPIDA